MQVGPWQLDSVSGGRFRLDGGAMFGIVPKPLWERKAPADERNRIRLNTNCVLARDGEHTLLIDTGFGTKATEKERDQLASEPGDHLLASLAELEVVPEDVDAVIFSHLHFDHAGGATRYDRDGRLVATFAGATFIASSLEWQSATSDVPELEGIYPAENIEPLAATERVRLVEDGEEIFPSVHAMITGGHTQGHMAIMFGDAGDQAIYLGDLCPTAAHLRAFWSMGYDIDPLETRRKKPELLGRLADSGGLLLFDHDPDMAAVRIARDDRKEFVITEQIEKL